MTTKEAFSFDIFYHEYLEDHTFKTNVKNNRDHGTWELSIDNETLSVHFVFKKGELSFKILKLTDEELQVIDNDEKEEIILNFKKV
jgi:hypothetical protein